MRSVARTPPEPLNNRLAQNGKPVHFADFYLFEVQVCVRSGERRSVLQQVRTLSEVQSKARAASPSKKRKTANQ